MKIGLALVTLISFAIGILCLQTPGSFERRGGTRITFDVSAAADSTVNGAESAKVATVQALRSRFEEAYGRKNVRINAKAKGQIVVDVAGKESDEVAAMSGPGADIKMYWAKNLKTFHRNERPYTTLPSQTYTNGEPYVNFMKGDRQVSAGTTEYAEIIAGWGNPILESTDFQSASIEPHGTEMIPEFHFSKVGAEKIEKWCRWFKDDGENIAVVLDGTVLSTAPLKEGAIITDSAIIDGSFGKEYVASLVHLINSGKLPADVREVSREPLGEPSTTKRAIGFAAFLIAVVSYCAFVAMRLRKKRPQPSPTDF